MKKKVMIFGIAIPKEKCKKYGFHNAHRTMLGNRFEGASGKNCTAVTTDNAVKCISE